MPSYTVKTRGGKVHVPSCFDMTKVSRFNYQEVAFTFYFGNTQLILHEKSCAFIKHISN